MAAISNFLNDHRLSVASLVGLGSIIYLAEEIIAKPKQASQPHLSVRVSRLIAAVFVLLIAVTQLLLVPLEHVPEDLSGKTYLVTGCTPGGIGYETAKTLMEWNASTVVCTMRTPAKGEALKASLKDSGPGTFDVVTLELTSLDSVRQAAEEIKTRFGKLDGIVLNAGIMPAKREITKDGFEEQYQVNHLSQFLLLRLLEDWLKPWARVVFVASNAHNNGKLDREVYGQKPGGRQTSDAAKSQWLVYTDTKLMNVLSANAFAKRLASKDVRVTSVCPGLVPTGFQIRTPRTFVFDLVQRFSQVFGRTLLQGAMRGLHLLTSKAHADTTGKYFDSYFPFSFSNEITEDNAEWLWNKSNELLGISN